MYLMRKHQFGRLENMSIRDGQPIFDRDMKLVRITRLGSERSRMYVTTGDDFELKSQIRELFEELDRLQDGTVIRLEFRHGLPFLLETAAE